MEIEPILRYFHEKYSKFSCFHDKIRKKPLWKLKINIILLIATFCTTFHVNGPLYAVCIMTILLAHELGHYFMCRKYNVEATLPYFLPMPFPPFGTFGAVIKMRGQIPSKKALFDIGAAGPIGGLIFALPIVVIGLSMSKVAPTNHVGFLSLGEPLLFTALSKIVCAPVAEGFDIVLHPVAFAGWAGLFVTALNLLPIGQLDGGHIVYALLGEKSKIVFKVGVGVFCLVAAFIYHGWAVFAILLLFFGFRHPAPIDSYTNIGTKRRWIGIALFIVFVISFTPVPLKF